MLPALGSTSSRRAKSVCLVVRYICDKDHETYTHISPSMLTGRAKTCVNQCDESRKKRMIDLNHVG